MFHLDGDSEALYAELLFKRAQCVLASEDWPQAIKEFKVVIEFVDPTSPLLPHAYNKIGVAFYRMYEYWNAITMQNKAIDLDPKCFQAYHDRSEAYMALNMEKEGKEDAKQFEFLARKKAIGK